MLGLTVIRNDSIVIGDGAIEVTLIDFVSRDDVPAVNIAVRAPKDLPIYPDWLHRKIRGIWRNKVRIEDMLERHYYVAPKFNGAPILTRAEGDSIMIGDSIEVAILEINISSRQVHFGIQAPRITPVHRKKIYEKVKSEQALASVVTG